MKQNEPRFEAEKIEAVFTVDNPLLYDVYIETIVLKHSHEHNIPRGTPYVFEVKIIYDIMSVNDSHIFTVNSKQRFIFRDWSYSQKGKNVINDAIKQSYSDLYDEIHCRALIKGINTKLLNQIAGHFSKAAQCLSN